MQAKYNLVFDEKFDSISSILSNYLRHSLTIICKKKEIVAKGTKKKSFLLKLLGGAI